MRRLLGMLRKDDDPRALEPQPGLEPARGARIDSLRGAGLACELRIEGEPIDLTPGHRSRRLPSDRGGAAGRRRIGTSGTPLVTVRYEPRELELEIRGDGTDARPR